MYGGIATHYCESGRIAELEQALINLENVNDIEHVLNTFCPKNDLEFSLAKYLPQINKCFNASTVEEILKNLEEDGTEWAKETIKVERTFFSKCKKKCTKKSTMDDVRCIKHHKKTSTTHSFFKLGFANGITN